MGLLCCFFYISALAVYLAVRAGRIPYSVAGYVLCLVLFCLALASKEKAVTLPVALVLAEIAFFWHGWKSLFKRMGIFAAILLPLLGMLALVERPHGVGGEALGIFATIAKYYEASNLTLSQVVISQCRVLFNYLALIVVPVPSNVQFHHRACDIQLALGISRDRGLGPRRACYSRCRNCLDPKTAAHRIWVAFLSRQSGAGVILCPALSLFCLQGESPMFGLLVVLGDVLLEILVRTRSLPEQKWYWGPVPAGLLAAMLVAVMSLVTVSKSNLWQDPVAFWTDS